MKPGSKRLRIFLGAASLGLLVILAVPSGKEPTPAAAAAAAPPTPPPGVAAAQEAAAAAGISPEQLAEQRARSASLTFGRDPFRHSSAGTPAPITREAAPQGIPRLTGISIYERTRMAIVDRQLVRKGDQLHSGHTVVKITARAVTLSLNDERTTLTLGEQP